MYLFRTLIFGFALTASLANAQGLWHEGNPTPVNGLWNPLNLSPLDFETFNYNGRYHALHYPVETTGLLLPYYPIKATLDSDINHPLKQLISKIIKNIGDVESFDHMNEWLGLHTYPEEEGQGPYLVPQPQPHALEEDRMGFTLIEKNQAKGFTHSCAACHSANLFGKKIIGLTNRFPRANDYFVKGRQAFPLVGPKNFQWMTGASDAEAELLTHSKENIRFVESVKPVQLGLDTSLAHVAISLSRRAKGPYAEKKKWNATFPRKEVLRDFVADSKPGVWWNVKYKNRWLLDGSVVAGNPIFTNLLWNEIGRGADLHELENWLKTNTKIIDELTTAVFAAEAPRITDFFDESYFDLEKAKLGEKIFKAANCATCHGTYKKAWHLDDKLKIQDAFLTLEVRYPEQTPVKNVGTDPNRYQGMESLLQLNDLAISKKNGILIKVQEGYVPPPLVGIWARWPYFHNNSIPNLCALFSPPNERPTHYYAGHAIDPKRDFDFSCNGYPLNQKTPSEWKTEEFLYRTDLPGSSNSGHYKMFLDENGNERFSQEEKLALIHFLQSL